MCPWQVTLAQLVSMLDDGAPNLQGEFKYDLPVEHVTVMSLKFRTHPIGTKAPFLRENVLEKCTGIFKDIIIISKLKAVATGERDQLNTRIL